MEVLLPIFLGDTARTHDGTDTRPSSKPGSGVLKRRMDFVNQRARQSHLRHAGAREAMSGLWNTFGFSDEQRMMRDSVLDLLARELPPERIRELDGKGEFPHAAYAALAQAGWMQLPFKEAYGGTGGSHKDLAVLVEAMAYHYSSMATAYLITCVYSAQHIALFGSEPLKREVLPQVAQGKQRLAIAISEPEAGSDAAAIRTRAEKKGGRYLVNGQKTYITCAHVADHFVVIAKTDPAAGRNGISALLVDAVRKATIRPMQTLGWRTTHPNEIFRSGRGARGPPDRRGNRAEGADALLEPRAAVHCRR
jgi:alkylation response protein AidB-like acyl-CoA dehydrogenase